MSKLPDPFSHIREILRVEDERIAGLKASIKDRQAKIREAKKYRWAAEVTLERTIKGMKCRFATSSGPQTVVSSVDNVVRRERRAGSLRAVVKATLSADELLTDVAVIAAVGSALSRSDENLRSEVLSALRSLKAAGVAENVVVDGKSVWALVRIACAA